MTDLDTPTVSASGAMIGMDRTARPEEEEMKNPSTINTSIIRMMNRIGFMPLIAFEKNSRIVSEIIPSSRMTLIPRATPTTRATLIRSAAPPIN